MVVCCCCSLWCPPPHSSSQFRAAIIDLCASALVGNFVWLERERERGRKKKMAKKRKVVDAAAAPVAALEEAEPPRKRTLLGRKENGHHQTDDEVANKPVFRNKEKVLVLCSRRITFRFATTLLLFAVLCINRVVNALRLDILEVCCTFIKLLPFTLTFFCSPHPNLHTSEDFWTCCLYRYRHLMMDVMALLPHSKKDVKVQAKDNKSSTLNELTDLKGCSSCLLFEVCSFHFSDSSFVCNTSHSFSCHFRTQRRRQ